MSTTPVTELEQRNPRENSVTQYLPNAEPGDIDVGEITAVEQLHQHLLVTYETPFETERRFSVVRNSAEHQDLCRLGNGSDLVGTPLPVLYVDDDPKAVWTPLLWHENDWERLLTTEAYHYLIPASRTKVKKLVKLEIIGAILLVPFLALAAVAGLGIQPAVIVFYGSLGLLLVTSLFLFAGSIASRNFTTYEATSPLGENQHYTAGDTGVEPDSKSFIDFLATYALSKRTYGS